MHPLPSGTLRSNRGTWAVPTCQLPAVARAMLDALKPETFDPQFLGQSLVTTYFDTAGLDLRKTRCREARYLTLRLRCYGGGEQEEVYALSAKTESEKFRREIDPATADFLRTGANVGAALAPLLPANLQARLASLVADDALGPAACVLTRRYAVENAEDRLTLDTDVRTDTGKRLSFHVLEWKRVVPENTPPGRLDGMALRPIKLSKFLWATGV